MTFVKLNFVLSGTILSVAVVFYQIPKSKFWHAEKIDLEKSFKMSTNLTSFAFVNTEIFSFKVRNFFFWKKSNLAFSWNAKKLIFAMGRPESSKFHGTYLDSVQCVLTKSISSKTFRNLYKILITLCKHQNYGNNFFWMDMIS